MVYTHYMADEPAADGSALVDLRHSLKQVKHFILLLCCADLQYAMRWAIGSFLVDSVYVFRQGLPSSREPHPSLEDNGLLTLGHSQGFALFLQHPPSLLTSVQGFWIALQ